MSNDRMGLPYVVRQSSNDNVQVEQLTGSAIKAARQRQNFTQRTLAEQLGKSQSWVRDVENGRFNIMPEDQVRLRQTLEIY